jgi:hypothetical protein
MVFAPELGTEGELHHGHLVAVTGKSSARGATPSVSKRSDAYGSRRRWISSCIRRQSVGRDEAGPPTERTGHELCCSRRANWSSTATGT